LLKYSICTVIKVLNLPAQASAMPWEFLENKLQSLIAMCPVQSFKKIERTNTFAIGNGRPKTSRSH
jgi:hypothetical protein